MFIPKRGTVERPGFPHEVAAWVVRENACPARGRGVCTGLNFNPPRLCVRTLAHIYLLTWLPPSPFSPAPLVSCGRAEGDGRPTLQPDLACFPRVLPAYMSPSGGDGQTLTVSRGALSLTFRALELWGRFWIFVWINCSFN